MPEDKSYEALKEKALEIILNFKVQDSFDKDAANEILRLKGEIKRAITTLSKEKQEILGLRYFQNLSPDIIAQKVGRTKEEVVQILLSGINSIKENIKEGEAKLSKLQKTIKIPEVLPSYKKQDVSPLPMRNENKSSMSAVFISMVVFAVVFICTYFFAQKYFVDQLPSFDRLVAIANNFVQDRIVSSEVSKQLGQAKRKKKTFKDIDPNKVKITGSTSLVALTRRWENTFNTDYPKYQVDVDISDSDRGIDALIEGEVGIANSSRPVTFLDQKKAADNGLELVEHRVALDALIIVVNKKNPIEELSLDDLEGIFTGEFMNWQLLGGFNKNIIPVVREKGSGTNDFAISRILQGNDFPHSIVRRHSNQEITKLISENEGAISFVNSTNYPWEEQNVKYIKVKNYDNSISVPPFEGQRLNEDAIRYGDYPLAHYLYLIVSSEAPAKVEEYVDWVRGPKGQRVVEYSGLLPVVTEE